MRVRVVVLLVLITGSLAWVGTQALSGNLVYYVTPTELLHQHPAPNERLRLGGQVVPGSLHDVSDGVDFVVTDGTTRMTVVHTGSTPALFKSGTGVVLEGTYGTDGAFHSDNMLVKHGEEYRPPPPGETPPRRGDLMPALVGTLSLALALALAVYGVTAAIVGARTGRPRVVESARTAAYSLFALVVVANLAMLAALLANDFSLRYVASNSSRATPTFFKMLALWSADEGSLLLWNLVLGGYLAAVAFRFRRRRPETFPWALAVIFGISAFYLVLVLGPTTPFATLATAPPDGRGPLPLLQNHPLMAAHPPFLYLGFIGFTVPFAFAIAALITGRVSDAWMRITRRWTISAWIFLTIGLTLGALWSYSVLGWGGDGDGTGRRPRPGSHRVRGSTAAASPRPRTRVPAS